MRTQQTLEDAVEVAIAALYYCHGDHSQAESADNFADAVNKVADGRMPKAEVLKWFEYQP